MRRVLAIALFLMVLLPVFGCHETINKGFEVVETATEMTTRNAWKIRAKQGDVAAQYEVAKGYCCGKRPEKDTIEALYWFCEAGLNGGQRDALLEVARIYGDYYLTEGDIVPVNRALSYAYASEAADALNPLAAEYKAIMYKKLTTQERLEALEYLAKWPDVPCRIARLPEKTLPESTTQTSQETTGNYNQPTQNQAPALADEPEELDELNATEEDESHYTTPLDEASHGNNHLSPEL